MIAVGMFGKVRLVGFLTEPVPFGCEHTAAANFFKGNPQPADAREKVNEAESIALHRTSAALVRHLAQLVELEGIDTLAGAINVAADRTIAH